MESAPTTILVIDDDDSLRAVLSLALRRQGYHTMDAANGRLGLKKLSEAAADLIVTDLVMPDSEGLETIMEIRRHFPHTGIVAMSGQAADYLFVAEKLGARRTLSKPFTVDQFIGAVREALAA